ncbi:CobW family GTP-binding protein [Phytoactinopolyspora halotolerans]|uniref:Cobalamin biosynthesis protein CobW n=1 Tax=Phytoactinopolyspora halotolerans TaxID=1981512 RepID=A0A6L9S3H5_9ACTN|nr:GTP-binding protein [Phytoactinopolyspora halotolerans]NED98977.1 cobalamin biosynthesis protein CobW [Phytoactinopolyspora halotolerans]
MPAPLPLTILSTVDPVLRDSTAFTIALDAPGTVVLSYVMKPHGILRTISDTSGVLESDEIHLEHVCLNCALREDVIPTLMRLSELERWRAAVLALPVGAEPIAVAEALAAVEGDIRVASVISVVDLSTLENDVLGEDLLGERGQGMSGDDQRAVGEALAHQLEYADIVISTDSAEPDARSSALLEQLRSRDALRWSGVDELAVAEVFGHHHDPHRSARRMDPRHVAPSLSAGLVDGVWTLDLQSPRPFHPRRLMESIEELGAGRIRARGRFWLPTRPDTLCVWDGAGGQLAIGDGGPWGDIEPSTRLVITGTGDERRRLRRAFHRCLLTNAEFNAGDTRWQEIDDGFSPWLGDYSAAA